MSDLTTIRVNRKAEQAFRRRAISKMPNECIEALYGKIKGNEIRIYAFMPIEHTATKNSIYYDDEIYDESEQDAADIGLQYFGSVHSHPECSDCRFSETDLMTIQETQDIVMGICSILSSEKEGKKRHKTKVEYWPAPRPFKVIYS